MSEVPDPYRAPASAIGRMAPFEAFSVLFANDDDVRGWHDRWARTRVVRVR